LTLSIPQSSGSVNGYLSSTDFATFNAKQNAITLTTTGTSGAATLVGSTLNIPNYADTDTGITSLNGLTALTQTFATGTSGTDFGISSATSTHTFNLPTASASNRGALSSADWTTFNNKASTAALANYLPLAGGTLTGVLGGTSATFSSAATNGVSIVNTTSAAALISFSNTDNGHSFGFSSVGTGGQRFSFINGGLAEIAYITSAGAATFSSSVTTGGDIILGDYATATTKVLDLRTSNSLFTIATDGTAGGLGTTISYSWANGGQGPLKFNNAAGEVMRLSSNGNVNIGTTYNGRKLNIGGSAYVDMVLKSTSASGVAGGGTLYFGNSADEIAYVNYDHASNYMSFATNNSEKMRITSAGGVILKQGISLSDATVTTSGIEFPATQVASASANNLDDYEEGTFTPSVIGSTSAGTATYTTRFANYTKIGRQVSIQIDLEWYGGTGIGDLSINGLPFNSSGTTNPAVTIGYLDGVTLTALNYAMAYVANYTNRIDFVQIPIGGGAVSSISYDTTARIIVNATYIV
jgi:hypothetical protein